MVATRAFQVFVAVLLSASALAVETAAVVDAVQPPDPQIGGCAIFREGGAGWLLKAPTYWLKGSIVGISRERRMANLCPQIGKPTSAYTQAERLRVAAASPCVLKAAEIGEVSVIRVQLAVEAWETPWSSQHGAGGWLFRGQFLDQTLSKGEVVDIDANWLEPCEAGS